MYYQAIMKIWKLRNFGRITGQISRLNTGILEWTTICMKLLIDWVPTVKFWNFYQTEEKGIGTEAITYSNRSIVTQILKSGF